MHSIKEENDMKERSKDELIVISSGYPDETGDYLLHTFVKGFVDEAKEYCKKINVIVLLPHIPLPFGKSISKFPKNLKSYSYDNINVIYEKYPYIPIWPFTKFKGRIAYFFSSSKVNGLVNKNSIIHANFTSPAGVFANLICRQTNKDYTLTIHEDHDWLMHEIKSNNSLLISAWKNAKTIIRVNKLDNAILSQFNKNVITIPNGYNHRKFKVLDKEDCRKKLKIINKKYVVVNIGFYNEQKNQKLIIDAIELLPDNLKNNLQCYIIGGGPKQQELKSQVDVANLNDTIEIVGQVKHDELPFYLNAADVFCLSSNSEGNPTVMFEALGAGIPYVGSNVGGVPEIITSEEYGFLCTPKSAEKLNVVLEKGLNKKWNKDKIIEYSKQFSWKEIFLTTKQNY